MLRIQQEYDAEKRQIKLIADILHESKEFVDAMRAGHSSEVVFVPDSKGKGQFVITIEPKA